MKTFSTPPDPSCRAVSMRGLRAQRGFALVISLSLMVLITILAVALLSLSTISVRTSGRGEAMAEARANARMGLMLALGELQTLAGPDQRTTGTADLAGDDVGNPVTNGTAPQNQNTVNGAPKGLSAVNPGTRHWTGVWKQSTPAQQMYSRTPAPELEGWLVSGNENRSASDRITPAEAQYAVNAGGGVDGAQAAVLAGENSVGQGNVEDYVSAPLVEIQAPSRGTATAARHPSGRHAWWIGDEGVKAKLNLRAHSDAGATTTYAALSSPRRGWETVDGFESYPIPGGPDEERLGRLVSTAQAALVDGAIGGQGNTPLKQNFHSATAYSMGVLSDPVQGGLKLDLTAYLSGTLPTTPLAGLINSPVADVNIIPTAVANRLKGPKWRQLKDFYDLATQSSGTGTVKPAPSDAESAFGPIITDLRILFGARLVASGADGYRIQPCAKIAVSLANPYPYPLRWSGALELEIKNVTNAARRPARLWGANGQPAYVPYYPGEPAVLNQAIFSIPAGTLPPGEAKAYTMSGPVVRPQGSTGRTVIPMGDFGSSNPSDFSNSVFLDHAAVTTINATTPADLDVREDAITTQVNVELRTGSGANTLIRRIERFELDNAPYAETRRRVTQDLARRFSSGTPKPFPLQLYSFQVSQPGADYASLLPAANQLGLRGSTLRTFTDFNLQATRYRKPIISYNPPPFFMQIANSPATLPFDPNKTDTGSDFTRNLAVSPLPWGRSPFDTRQNILFSPPRDLVSLAQLQHADLTGDDIYVSVGHQPGNAVGNSYATPFVTRNRAVQSRPDYTITDFTQATAVATNYYDISYLLNTALWDTYYFSTVTGGGSGARPENERMVVLSETDASLDLEDPRGAAGRLMVDGAHNVNSVDKNAWKALLAGSKHLAHPGGGSGGSSATDALFPRSLEQTGGTLQPPTGSGDDSFSGYRRLTDDQIDLIAEEITRQVRLRGPFLSLSHFVNRALVALNVDRDLGRSGALQSALDNAGANISPDGTKNIFADLDPTGDRVLLLNDGSAPRADLAGNQPTSISNSGSDGTWPPYSYDRNAGAVASILADKMMLSNNTFKREQGYRSTGIPGWITQADLLQVIGPSLASRSDTFRLRAYGESIDPATGDPVARAWCEAVVQRVPSYVDPSNSPIDRDAELTTLNQKFGRRFQVTSFRWLSPNEI